mmetsp:Transcript_89701/g.159391  ORF Transcript_89701/g.159391 Transcript_89701/m.159391 type:complete len:989 (+) Transcript_89701:65-3031(+)
MSASPKNSDAPKKSKSSSDAPPDPSKTPLWKLLRHGCYQQVEAKLRKDGSLPTGVKIDSRDHVFNWSLLHFAANAGEPGLMEWLLKKKAKLELTDSEGNTALMLAARQNHVEAVEFLIGREANLEAKTKDHGFTALIWAASSGQPKTTDALLQASSKIEAKDAKGRTAIMWASKHGHLEVVNIILGYCPDLTKRDMDGFTALDHTREHLELKAAVVLAQEQCRRLLDGAQRNDFKVVETVLKKRAHPQYRDASGWAPLTWAVLNDSAEMAALLVRHGACAELLGEDSELGEQIASGHRSVGEKLAAVLGANTRLLHAAQAADFAAVQEALDAGGCPDAAQGKDGGGGGQAIREGFVHPADLVDEIMAGAEEAMDAGEEPGGEGAGRNMTSMMWAARHGHAEMIKVLGTFGGDVTLRDARGWTAMLFAMMSCDAKTISMLHYFQADVTQKGFEGESALHLAVRMDSGVAVQLLLAAESDIQEKDLQGRTPLHTACYYGSLEACSVLLWFKADAKAKDKVGRTPFLVACSRGSADLIEVILADDLEDLPELPVWMPEEDDPVVEVEDIEGVEGSQIDGEGDEGQERPGSATGQGSDDTSKTGQDTRQGSKSATKDGVERPSSANAKLTPRGSPQVSGEATEQGTAKQEPPAKDPRAKDSARVRTPPVEPTEKELPAKEPPEKESRRSSVRSDARRSSGSIISEQTIDEGAEGEEEDSEEGDGEGSESEIIWEGIESEAPIIPEGEQLLILANERRTEKMENPPRVPGHQLLTDVGGKLNRSALHYNISAGKSSSHYRVLLKLIKFQAEANATDKNGMTALMLAAKEGYSQACEKMVGMKECNPALKEKTGKTAADFAEKLQLKMMLERAIVAKKTGKPGGSGSFSEIKTPEPVEASPDDTVVFRVRLEKLPLRMSQEELEYRVKILMKTAVVKPVRIEVPLDPIMGRPRGHAYADFLDSRSATKAMDLDGQDVAGSKIRTFRDLPSVMVR